MPRTPTDLTGQVPVPMKIPHERGRFGPERSWPSVLLLALALLCVPLVGAAQEAPPPAGGEVRESPSVTVLGGVGLSMGWFGGQVSVYALDGRLSGYAGAGYTPDNGEGHPAGAAFAVGARAHSAGPKHRWFAGLGYGLLMTVSEIRPGPDVGERVYGPALLGGYQYTAGSGFTALAGVGVGYSGASDLADQDLVPTLDLGFGYTWR